MSGTPPSPTTRCACRPSWRITLVVEDERKKIFAFVTKTHIKLPAGHCRSSGGAPMKIHRAAGNNARRAAEAWPCSWSWRSSPSWARWRRILQNGPVTVNLQLAVNAPAISSRPRCTPRAPWSSSSSSCAFRRCSKTSLAQFVPIPLLELSTYLGHHEGPAHRAQRRAGQREQSNWALGQKFGDFEGSFWIEEVVDEAQDQHQQAPHDDLPEPGARGDGRALRQSEVRRALRGTASATAATQETAIAWSSSRASPTGSTATIRWTPSAPESPAMSRPAPPPRTSATETCPMARSTSPKTGSLPP